MNSHLVILKRSYLDAILDGRKTIELRLTKNRHPAFGRISVGQRLFLKESAGPVRGLARVERVEHFQGLTPARVWELKSRYNRYILGADEFWQAKIGSRFAFMVWLARVRAIEPIRIEKKDWRAWVVLRPGRDFGLLGRDITVRRG